MSEFENCLESYQARIHTRLDEWLPDSSLAPKRLHQAMRYASLTGGKRLRAVCVYSCGELFGADPAILDIPACAVECMHAYSLVHDDMPAMDDDNLRRGNPTTHVKYDEGTALLAGDALQAFAIELLSNPCFPPASKNTRPGPVPGGTPSPEWLDTRRRLQLVRLLSNASGSQGMAGGQGIDLESVGKALDTEALETMHRKKTGALIRASALMGAVCGRDSKDEQLAHLDCFADHFGLLFQITDDILDETSTDQQLGKTAGKDRADDKPTYTSILGFEGARDQALTHHRMALASLDFLDGNTGFLKNLNDFVLNRSY